jgi:glycosidase
MQWDASESGGFTTGTPWLAATDPMHRNVSTQAADPTSLLSLYRSLMRLRPLLAGPLELLTAEEDRLSYRRGRHVVELNFSSRRVPVVAEGRVVLTSDHSMPVDVIAPHGGVILDQSPSDG